MPCVRIIEQIIPTRQELKSFFNTYSSFLLWLQEKFLRTIAGNEFKLYASE